MQVILLDNVTKLGHLGETVNVSRGYARNFLFPTGKAVPSSASNIAVVEAQKAELQKRADDRLASAQAKATEVAASEVIILAKASDEGKLYGSIGTSEIAKAFKQKNIEVRRQDIRLPTGPLRELGEFEVDIQLHADVVCTVKVLVQLEK